MKKYKQPGETFYCLAWTTVYLDFDTDKKRKGNLIAAGGFQNDIKIIEPNQLVCFEEIQGHKGVLECLMFHPHHPTWLLSAADTSEAKKDDQAQNNQTSVDGRPTPAGESRDRGQDTVTPAAQVSGMQ